MHFQVRQHKGGRNLPEQTNLQVCMLGKFSLTYAGRTISCSGTRAKLIWNLLAYLLCHRSEYVSSEELISIIWKNEKNDNPAGAVRTAVHRARNILSELSEDPSLPFLVSKNGGYRWNPHIPVVTDTDEFDRLAAQACSESGSILESCLAALELYEGKFLPMQSSEMWVMPVQTYYQNQYESLIDRAIPLLEQQGANKTGIEICRKALQINPYSETVYQYLMRLLLQEEERQEVIRIYEEMSKLLLSAFGIMPDQESRALYREALRSDNNTRIISPEIAQEQLNEQGEIRGALVCDYDFFRMMYQAQARTIVRSGQVIHTVLFTLKNRGARPVSEKSISLAMDNLEKHLSRSLRKGDIITRCSSSQFIVMLPSANYENSCKVCQRLISGFEKKYPHSPIYVDFYVQPLIPSTKS